MNKPPWTHVIGLGAVARMAAPLHLEPSEDERKRIARLLQIDELRSLTADVTVSPWFDGAQLEGRWRAEILQTCGVSLEPLPSSLDGDFVVRVVPPDSPHAPGPSAELAIDLEADDPPDVLESDEIDLAAYVVEHLALEIDPFPRKEGAEFQPPQDGAELSPFAVLRRLQKPDEA